MLKVVVIGSGNVAQHLIQIIDKSAGAALVQAYARHPEQLAHLIPPDKITGDIATLPEADIYIIAVNDDAITEVSSLLTFSGRLVVHTSGSAALHQADERNRRGVFYPLQTFSKNKPVDFNEIPLCLESEFGEDYSILEQLAYMLTPKVYNINSQQRKALHVAAVFVSNFVNHMYYQGNSICHDSNVPFEILKPLIKETADKINTLSPGEAQTGPAQRNDHTTIQKHLEFIQDDNQKAIYALLTQSIQKANV